jgi:membrane protease YdiL (CAAX protease family)
LAWPPPLSARWTALALFLFAMALHLFVAVGGTLVGIDFKRLIIVDELGAILLAPILIAMLLGLRYRDAFLMRSTHWAHYVAAVATAVPLQLFGGALQEIVLDLLPGGDAWRELLEDALEPLLRGNSTADLLLLMLGAVVLAAVCEEVLFRGLMMQLLARGGRWRSAIFISALLFAVFHLDFIGLLPRTLLGIYFGILVWRSGSIFPAMLAHGANNLLAFALLPYADAAAPSPTLQQALLLAGGAGTVFVVMLVAYLRLTRPPDEGPPHDERGPVASAEANAIEAFAPTDTSTPPDSTHRTGPHES